MESPPQKPKKNEKGSRSIKGGSREGSGRPNLQDLNLVPLQTRMSLSPEVLQWLDMCAKLRDGEPKKYPERHRVDVLRDILTAVANLIRSSGYSDAEQAQLTKRLHEILVLKEGEDNG